MSTNEWLDQEPLTPPTTNSKKKSKGTARQVDDPIDETFDNMLESAGKPTNATPSSKSNRRAAISESASGWSNDINDDNGNLEITTMPSNQPPVARQSNRRVTEEIIASDIPTIPMDDGDNDDIIDLAPQIAVAPEFSIHQIASFKEIENDFCRERASQYIDSKIDIGILYNNLHLQEELDSDKDALWEWDKVFVEIRNSITNSTT